MTKSTTTTTPADRLAAAKAAEGAARDRLTAFREAIKAGQQVDDREYGTAAHAVETAELRRQGAEFAFAEAQRQERMAKLAEIRADIEAMGGAGIEAAAEERAAEALAAIIIRQAELQRKIRRWGDQLRALGVEETRGDAPDEKDAGLGWRSPGRLGRSQPAVVVAGVPDVMAGDPGGIVERVIQAAARKAGVGTAMLRPLG